METIGSPWIVSKLPRTGQKAAAPVFGICTML